MAMNDLPGGQKKTWKTPELTFDGELRDFVQGTQKPPTITGEPGDVGHRPSAPAG